MSFDVFKIRKDFPILDIQMNDEPLVYLDNAATAQKPQLVIDKVQDFYEHKNSNVHRGVYALAQAATDAYEQTRAQVASFINAASEQEIVFTSGTTAGINLIAAAYQTRLSKGDEILISILEHHSNIVPWQILAKRTGATLRYIDRTQAGALDLEDLKNKLSNKVKIVALTHVSNVLGTINPIRKITDLAHSVGAVVLVDGAQAIPHFGVDVQALDADYYVFSGHKICGPTGIGILYGKKTLLDECEPVFYGGEMIDFVYKDESTWKETPWKFEAGTQHIAGVMGLSAAIDYIKTIGYDQIQAYEQEMLAYVMPKLKELKGIELFGLQDTKDRIAIFAFNLEGIHPHDLATALDMQGVAVRAGHHCAQPLMQDYNQVAMTRASFYFYNTLEEADRFIAALIRAQEFFKYGTI